MNILVFNKVSFIFIPIVVLIKTIVLPIILSAIVYYLLVPIVDFFDRKGIKRIYSIIVLYLIIIGIITIPIVLVIPFLRDQIMRLIESFPNLVNDIEMLIEQFIGSQFLNQVQQTLNINVSDLATQFSKQSANILNSTFAGVGIFIGSGNENSHGHHYGSVYFVLLIKGWKKTPNYMLGFLNVHAYSHIYGLKRNEQAN